jgi:hypothetical protein
VSDEVVEMAECDAQHIGHVEDAHVGASRAKQTIPPAVRRKVLARDHHRCRAPGCRCATFVDVHHRKPRSEGGTHAPDNLITLCSAHHTALHRGTLIIDGPPDSPRFLHADGTPYGGAASPGVRAVFRLIARDETRHGQLAWDVRAWLDPRLTATERRTVARRHRGALAALPHTAVAQVRLMPAGLGFPEPEEARRAAERFVRNARGQRTVSRW